MPRLDLKPKSQLEIDHRKAVLSLRWLLVILASYLSVFTYLGKEGFLLVFGVALTFSVSNLALILISRQAFAGHRLQKLIAFADFIFVSMTLFLLRVPGNYLYLAFIAVFALAVLWRDLRLVLFSLFSVSLLFGVFSYFRLFKFQVDVNIEQFLRLALFFVVSIFYIFLSERLTQDAKVSDALLEENRLAEVMVEITRTLSSSLNSGEVLFAIVSRLREVLDAQECSIVRIDPKTGKAQIMVKSSDPAFRNVPIELSDYPA